MASRRPPSSRVVKCALSRITPLPLSNAARRCSSPTSTKRWRNCDSRPHQQSAVSTMPWPKERKCDFSKVTRWRLSSSGKHSRMLVSAISRRRLARCQASRPMSLPVLICNLKGRRVTSHRQKSSSHVGQKRGSRKRDCRRRVSVCTSALYQRDAML